MYMLPIILEDVSILDIGFEGDVFGCFCVEGAEVISVL